MGLEGRSNFFLSTTSPSYFLSSSLSLSHSHSLTLTLSIFHLTLPFSLSLSLPHSPSLSLSLTLSLLLSVCPSLSLSLSLSLFLLLNEPVIRIMHGDGSAKVSRKDLFSCEVGHFGNKEFRTTPASSMPGTSAIAESLYIAHIVRTLCHGSTRIVASMDSSSAKSFTTKRGVSKVRHLDTKFLWIPRGISNKAFSVAPISTFFNTADLGTKSLAADRVKFLLNRLQFDGVPESKAASKLRRRLGSPATSWLR